MAQINEYLVDTIGNEHERKNLYLKELGNLYRQLEECDDQARMKGKISELKKSKSAHNYVKKYNEFKNEEKLFLGELRDSKKAFQNSLSSDLSRKMKSLETRLFISQKKNKFYEAYQELSYDCQYEYGKTVIELNQIPTIISFLEEKEKELKEALILKRKLTSKDDIAPKEAFNKYKQNYEKALNENIKRLKEKKKQGFISTKALENEIESYKKEFKAAVTVKSYEVPTRGNREHIKSIKYDLSKTFKRKINVLESNIADLRRKTPMETERKQTINAYVSCLIPGLGQLLNKQYIKGILFFILTFFIYGIAIPYALGYGNYKGEGIAGLISLAQDGSKLDKSIIFMIEGVIAIFMLVFAVAFYIVSFRDVLIVERDSIKGMRPKNWFETKSALFEESFPYIVSLPALVVIVFLVLVPISTTFLLGFSGMDPKHQSKFGWQALENYKLLVMGQGIAGKAFWYIFGWTVVWTLVATSLAIAIGFLLALILNNERIKGKVFFRSIYLLPWAVPAFITVMFFSIMLSRQGILTSIIVKIIGMPIEVKNDPFLSKVALIMIQGWLGSAYVFLLSTGVLQAIPSDLYEAAQIDGATAWQKLRKITVPLVLFQTAPLLVGQYTFNFNNFSIVYLFNGGGPFNPEKYGNLAGSTDLLISYIFKLTIQKQYQSIGAAITIFISLGLMFFAYLGFRNSKAFKEEKL